jgi:hypothetical protein
VPHIVLSGSRDFNDLPTVRAVLEGIHTNEPDTIVRVGDARGLDALVRTVAHRLGITLEVHVADWSKYGRAAGHVRNREMIEGAKVLLAFYGPNGRTPGTANAMWNALSLGVPVFLHRQGEEPLFTPITKRSETE